jgi:hypothetical protein
MPVGCNVMNTLDNIFGLDMHKNVPPPPPVGPVPAPHLVVATLGMAFPLASSKAVTDVFADHGMVVARQHDLAIGTQPYHFGVNALLPVVLLGAGNKSEFGVGSVQTKNGRLAVALVPLAGINPQLDCNEPYPKPTSMCIASFATVEAGFTLGDFIGGVVAMASDVFFTWLVSTISSKAIPWAIEAAFGIEGLLVAGLFGAAFPVAGEYAKEMGEMAVGWFIGTPLGYSFPFPWTGWGGAINDFFNDLFSPTPTP